MGETLEKGNGSNQPLTRREGDRIWATIDEMKQESDRQSQNIRDNFKMVFQKLDEVKSEFTRCPIHNQTLGDLRNRMETIEGGEKTGLMKILSGAYYLTVIISILGAGIWFLISQTVGH